MKFQYHHQSTWAPLAWLAQCTPSTGTINVLHGPNVETHPNFFCEAVWAGDFAAADFDRTDQFFGSGARLRHNTLTFVSSASTVDRLLWANHGNEILVSNSLACLMQHLDASVDPTFARYQQFFGTILHGFNDVQRTLQTSRGPIHLCYYRNLQLIGSSLTEIDKPESTQGFASFADYRDHLAHAIHQIGANLSDHHRAFPFHLLGTISSGYDSACVSALAASAGLKDVISFSHAKSGARDTGEATADKLGLNLTVLNRDAWRDEHLSEAPFIASDAKGEDVYFRGAQHLLRGRVLLTGFQGGKLWQNNSELAGRFICRSDRSGLSLTEYRLRAGFIHCPVCFIGARWIEDILRIGKSDEMKPWDLKGDYSKPIPRRILEEAGVPRNAFGIEKKAASVVFHSARNMLSPTTQRAFDRWLENHAHDFLHDLQIPPHLKDAALAPCRFVARRAWAIHNHSQSLPMLRKPARNLAEWGEKENLSWYLFPWAIDQVKRAYILPPIAQPNPGTLARAA
jgi:hypothetical protein